MDNPGEICYHFPKDVQPRIQLRYSDLQYDDYTRLHTRKRNNAASFIRLLRTSRTEHLLIDYENHPNSEAMIFRDGSAVTFVRVFSIVKTGQDEGRLGGCVFFGDGCELDGAVAAAKGSRARVAVYPSSGENASYSTLCWPAAAAESPLPERALSTFFTRAKLRELDVPGKIVPSLSELGDALASRSDQAVIDAKIGDQICKIRLFDARRRYISPSMERELASGWVGDSPVHSVFPPLPGQLPVDEKFVGPPIVLKGPEVSPEVGGIAPSGWGGSICLGADPGGQAVEEFGQAVEEFVDSESDQPEEDVCDEAAKEQSTTGRGFDWADAEAVRASLKAANFAIWPEDDTQSPDISAWLFSELRQFTERVLPERWKATRLGSDMMVEMRQLVIAALKANKGRDDFAAALESAFRALD
jgi:hypothetical protein